MKFDFLVGLVATLICLPALSFADGGGANDCSDIRLDQPSSDGTAGSMQSVQVRDQGTYGICYGETAVQLFDAYRFSRSGDSHTDAQSSALAATIDYSATTGGDAFSGGSTCAVLNYLSSDGTEDDASVTSCILNFETPNLVSGLQEIYDRESTQINAEKQQLLGENLSPQELRSEFSEAKQTIYQGDIANIQGLLASQGLSSGSGGMVPNSSAILSMMDMALTRVAWGLSAYACANSSQTIQNSVPTCVDSVPPSDASLLATWNSRLNLPDAEPIEVSYCDAVLREGRSYAGVTRNGNSHLCAPTNTTSTPNHASLIIGRRTNPETGSCQLLIRNSWGTACKISQIPPAPGNVLKDFRPSLPKATPIPDPSTDLRYAPEWDCDAGNIWVDADSLARSAYRTSWISDGSVSF